MITTDTITYKNVGLDVASLFYLQVFIEVLYLHCLNTEQLIVHIFLVTLSCN